jgi:hypothetical protein
VRAKSQLPALPSQNSFSRNCASGCNMRLNMRNIDSAGCTAALPEESWKTGNLSNNGEAHP